MRSRRGGCMVTRRSHHPALLRGHPSSGRRGIHFVRHSYEFYLTMTHDNQTKRAENTSRPSVWLAMTEKSLFISYA